jgi:CO/xanthine dehydrogenase FAD-binding subunit
MRYEAPQTFEAAVALLAAASGEARVLADGTDPYRYFVISEKTTICTPRSPTNFQVNRASNSVNRLSR